MIAAVGGVVSAGGWLSTTTWIVVVTAGPVYSLQVSLASIVWTPFATCVVSHEASYGAVPSMPIPRPSIEKPTKLTLPPFTGTPSRYGWAESCTVPLTVSPSLTDVIGIVSTGLSTVTWHGTLTVWLPAPS